jgi:serine/threonine protein kinase
MFVSVGAPECIRRDRFDDSRNKEITTSADIWSFACVLSEICVWVCFGYTQEHGVEGYRERRKEHNREAVRGSDCFHVDGEVSPAVADEHQKIIEQGRCDGTTKDVLEILTEMLMIDPRSRPTAAQVRRTFEDILGNCKGKKPARTANSTHKISASFSTAQGACSPLRARQNNILRSSETPHDRQSSAVYNMSDPYGGLMSSPRNMTGLTEDFPTAHDTSAVIAGAARFLTQEDSSGTFAEPGPAYGNHTARTLPVRSSDRHHGSGARSPTSPPHSAPDPRKSGRSSKQQSRRTTITSASVPDDRVTSKSGLSGTATPSVSGDGSENNNDQVQNEAPVCLHMDDALAWRRGSREGAKLSNRGLLSQLENRDHVSLPIPRDTI